MIENLFPKINELCVFVITVLLYVTIIISPELHELLGGLWQDLLQHWETLWSKADTFYQKLKFVATLLFWFIFFSFFSLGPLVLPFTQRDIRSVCIFILWLDAGLIIYCNSQTESEYPLVQMALILYWAAWLVYSFFVIRTDSANGAKRLVDDEQTTPVTALMISGFGCVFLLVFKFLLGWWWLDSYMAAVVFALLAKRFGDDRLSKIRDTERLS